MRSLGWLASTIFRQWVSPGAAGKRVPSPEPTVKLWQDVCSGADLSVRLERIILLLLVLAAGAAHADDASAPAAAGAQSEHAVELEEISVQPPEPQFVAPTTRDRIGRI